MKTWNAYHAEYPVLRHAQPRGVAASGKHTWKRADLVLQSTLWVQLQKPRWYWPPSRKRSLLAVPDHEYRFLDITSNLHRLDSVNGDTLDVIQLDRGDDLFAEFSATYGPQLESDDLDGDGVEEVLITYKHMPNYPCYTVLWSGGGESRVLYASTGHHDYLGSVDLDGDGSQELLFEEINNLWAWYTGIAAVPLGSEKAPAVLSPSRDVQGGGATLWYALSPSGKCNRERDECRDIDQTRRLLRFEREAPFVLTFDGFEPGIQRGHDPDALNRARRRVHRLLRESSRQTVGPASALAASEQAVEAAVQIGQSQLHELARRFRLKALIRAGRVEDALRLATEHISEYENLAGSVAFEVAVALHLAGELDTAVEWYGRGFGRGSVLRTQARPPWEHLRGAVIALGELGRWEDARQLVAEVEPLLNEKDRVPSLKAYIRWGLSGVWDRNIGQTGEGSPDLLRYWHCEYLWQDGVSADEMLAVLDRELRRSSETTPLLQSLKSRVLIAAGRHAEGRRLAMEALAAAEALSATSVIIRSHLGLITDRVPEAHSGPAGAH